MELSVFVALIYLSVTPGIAGTVTSEYAIKAAYVYNTIRFVDWPAMHFETEESVNLCIYGKGPISSALVPIKSGSAKNKTISIQTYSIGSSHNSCDVIYYSGLEITTIKDDLKIAQQNHALTISDIPGFARSGGMIELKLHSNRVRLVVNLAATSKAGLAISSKLLEIALEVIEE